MGAQGLEPWTYGLKGRCSAKLSYTPGYGIRIIALFLSFVQREFLKFGFWGQKGVVRKNFQKIQKKVFA